MLVSSVLIWYWTPVLAESQVTELADVAFAAYALGNVARHAYLCRLPVPIGPLAIH